MSFRATAWAEIQTTGSPGAKLVLLVLANYADKEGFSYPSQKSIAEITEQGVRTVQRHLNHLEEVGLLRRKERVREGGGRTSDAFYLLMDGPPAKMTGGDVSEMAGGGCQDGEGGDVSLGGSFEPSDEPSKESPIEPSGTDVPHDVNFWRGETAALIRAQMWRGPEPPVVPSQTGEWTMARELSIWNQILKECGRDGEWAHLAVVVFIEKWNEGIWASEPFTLLPLYGKENRGTRSECVGKARGRLMKQKDSLQTIGRVLETIGGGS